MNKLTKQITKQMRPSAALIAYACEDQYGRREYYLESRSIGKDGLMDAGKPVSYSFIKKLTESFSVQASSIPHGALPKTMLYADTRDEKYVWHHPSCRKQMYFKSDLNIPNGEYCIPGLVWMVEKSALKLFAYKAKHLTTNTSLYAAPFFNVNPREGNVCLGNARLELPEELSFHNFIQYWEDKFFLSEFSHILGSNPTKNNLVLVIKNSVKAFDHEELIAVKKLKPKGILKLKDILQ